MLLIKKCMSTLKRARIKDALSHKHGTKLVVNSAEDKISKQ